MNEYIVLSEEVKEAKEKGLPIIALESTIISHGMPYPQNVNTAREVEQIIRDNGAVPATVALMDGKIKVGLSYDELELFGSAKDVAKVSRRDMGYLLANKKLGATTVAATMIAAELAGINLFVTGGIGGVHRGAEKTMDISADLQEFAKTKVAVVCAGAKSILDIGLTLEYLETNGVPVMGYQTNEMPAFFTPKSGFEIDLRAENADEVAAMLQAKWALGLEGSAVIVNPILEKDALDHEFITSIINDALVEAEEKGITGKAVTPFLLGKVKELTDGKSLDANIALVKNNALVGSKIAVALNKAK